MSNPAITPAQAEDAVFQLEYDLVEIARLELGMHERQAYEIARVLVQGLRKRYGGVRLGHRGLYIPAPSKLERDAQIRQEFDGTNSKALQKKFGISRSRLYAIMSPKPSSARIGVSSAKSPVSSLESGRPKG